MEIHFRPAASADQDALYDICVRTSDSGRDASRSYRDLLLVGHVYSAPYVLLTPEWCFVAEDDDGVVGYVVGAPDTLAFEAELERSWWPELRTRYRDPGPPPHRTADDGRMYQIHHPLSPPEAVLARFPGHMHMNLLPRARGRGAGTTLFGLWRDRAVTKGVPGVHVAVGPLNAGGAAFWQACGLQPIALPKAARQSALWFGMELRAPRVRAAIPSSR